MSRNLFIKSIFVLTLLLLLIGSGSGLNAQISYGGKPWTFKTEKGGPASFINVEYDEITLKAPDVEHLIAEDLENASKDKIPRIGIDLDADISMETAGTWTELPMGARLWTLKVTVPGAKALNLGFENFHLAEGSKLFCYNENRRQVIGAFTSENNPKDGIFGIEVIQGENLYVEYYEPAYKKSGNVDKTTFHIFSVGYFYRDLPHLRYYEDIHTKSTGWQASGSCEVDVNCTPVGDNWQDEKRGVVEIFLYSEGEWGWCTGSLVNNTNNDGTPYLLTAFHCGEGQTTSSEYSRWQFYFKYEVPANQASGSGTNPNISEPAYKTLTGCTEKASGSITGGSDLLLLQLNTTPTAAYEPYYNGWNRANTAPSNGVGIHHPAGDVKKISTYTTSASGSYTGSASNAHWKLQWKRNDNGFGVTEGGSSGSPLFDSNGLIVGTLTGGGASCSSPTEPDYYGKFYYHWESNGTANNKRLKPWLDPTNSGVTTCPPYDPFASQPPQPDFAASRTTFLEGSSVDFYNYTVNNPVSYSWSFPGATPSSSTVAEPTEITYNTAGTYDVTLTATNANGTNTVTKNGYITVIPPTGSFCDTVSQFGGSIVNYVFGTSTAITGYVGGTNNYNMTAWAEKFTSISPYNQITGFRFFPVVATNGTDCNVTFKLWKLSNDLPSDVLATASIPLANVVTAMNTDGYIDVDFGEAINLPDDGFAIGFERPGTPANGDTLATYTNDSDGDYNTAYVYIGGAWSDYASLLEEPSLQYPMFPFVCYNGSRPPTVDFSSDIRQVEIGGNVTFTDLSDLNGSDLVSRLWTFEGGTPSTSTGANPVVTYSTQGLYQVSLTVANANGSVTKTATAYIEVYDPSAVSAFSLDFEACRNFQVDNFDPWTTYDGDGYGTYGISGADFENSGYTGSFIAFNASRTEPPLGENWSAHGGNRCGICLAPSDGNGTPLTNNDWLISPAITLGSNSSFSFWAKSVTDAYGLERFKVLVSTTNNNTSSFTKISAGNYIEPPTEWTQYTYNLSAYDGQTIYVAIQCVSNDKFAFMVDDILISSEYIAPDVDFTADNTTVEAGATVNFTDHSTRTPSSWEWSFEGGTPTTSTQQNPSVVYNIPGTYSVSLAATNAYGTNTETKTGYITVTRASEVIVEWNFPTTSADAIADTGILANRTKTLTVGGGVGNPTYNTNGASTRCASATNWQSGRDSKYWTVNFTTSGYENIKFSSKQSGNNNRSPRDFKVQYSLNGTTWNDVSGTNVTCARNNWTIGALSEISLPAACNNQTTVYLRWIMRSNTGIGGNTVNANTYASYIDDIVVKGIQMAVAPDAEFTANATSVCAGATVTFTDQSANNPTSWAWNFGDGNTSTDQNPTHTYATAGTYTVTLVATNDSGDDTETKTNYITVNANPTVSIATTETYCAGETAQINATVSGATSYSWSGPNGYTASTQNVSIANATSSNSGTYTITVENAASCMATASTSLTVNANPTLNVSNGGPYCTGATIALNANGNGGTAYSWTGPDEFTSNVQNPTIANADGDNAGTYTATLTNTTTGCSVSASTVVAVNALPTLNASNNGPYCEGSTITLSANGTGGTVYAWSGPNGYTANIANPTIANSTTANAGTYNVTLTNPTTGCSTEASTVVEVNANPTVTASNTGAYCAGQVIALSAVSADATSFAWSGPNGYTSAQQNPTIANAATNNGGSYTVVATNANNCTAQASTVVTVNANPTANASNTGAYCEGQTITLQTTATGTYAWSGPNGFSSTLQNPTVANATTANAGTYTLVVTNANNCTANATTTVTVNATPTVTASNTGAYCAGETISLSATSNATSFAWSGPNGFSSTTQNPTIANAATTNGGAYTVVVTNANNCTAEASTTVVVNTVPTINASNTGAYCEGQTISLSATSNATSFAWSGPNGFTSTLQNPTIANATVSNEGTYTVVATNANNCTANATTTVGVNTTPTVTASNTGAYCAGETISLNAISDATSFAWNGPNGFTSALQNPTIENAATTNGGSYTVVATSAAGCTANASTVVTVNANPVVDASNTGAYCEGATIALQTTATGTYAWSGPNGFSSTLQNPTIANATLANAGVYTLVVSNANNCTAEASTTVVVNANPTIELGNNVTVCTGENATLDAGAGLTYHWSNNATTQTISVPAGDYYVTVYNANECSATDNISVANYPQTTLVTTSTAETHNNSHDGTATVTPTGASPFQYNWSNNGNTATISGLAGGNYSVTVTDGNGCISTAIVNVATMNTPPVADFTVNNAENVTICLGAEVVFADLSTNTPTQWTWNFGDGQTSNVQNPTHTYAEAGSYNVSLTVANQDGTDSKQITNCVVVNAVPTATASNSGAYCAGETIELSVSSDIATEYQWTGPMGFSSAMQNTTRPNATTNHAGTYSVVVTTANGCSAVASTDVVVNANPTANASNTGAYCEGATIALQTTATGTYAWSGPNGFTSTLQNPTIENATLENAGEYTLIVSNESECSAQATTMVVVNANPTLTVSVDATYCAGETISLTANSDVTSFVWNGPNGYISAMQNPTITNVTPANSGTYTVVATSANGCSVQASTNVTVGANPVATITNNSGTTTLTCSMTSIELVANGGTSYSWNNGVANTAEFTASAAGDYTVVVTNENNCTVNASVTITADGDVPTISIDGTTAYCEGATISLSASSNVPVTYTWAGPNGYTASTAAINISNATSDNAGIYSASVVAANGCEASSTITVVVNANPTVEVSSNSPVCEGGDVTFTASSAESLSYSWSGPNGFASTEASPVISGAILANAGTYTLVVENVATGCGNTFHTELVVNAAPTVSLGDDITVCANVEATLNATAGFVSYTWNGEAGSQSFAATDAGDYTIVVADNNGCTASDVVTVSHYELPELVMSSTPESGHGVADGTASVEISGGTAPYAILWNNNETTAQITGLTNGHYTVVVTDDNGCAVNGAVDVNSLNTPPVAAFTADVESGCAPLTVNFTDNSTNFPQTWTWDFDGTTSSEQNPSHIFSEPGTYNVYLTVSNLDGSDIATMVITVYANPTVIVPEINQSIICEGSSSEITVWNDANISYEWSNGSTESTTVVTEAGVYTLTITDEHGCTATASFEMAMAPVPEVSLGTDIDVCENSEAEINAGEGYNWYNWSTGEMTQSIMVSAAGEYSVTVFNEYGCEASDTIAVSILAAPTFAISDTSTCVNEQIILNIDTEDEVLWFGETEGNTYAQTYPSAGEYLVWVTVSNGECETTDTITVTVETCTFVDEMAAMEIQLYPNPVRDMATFTVTGYEGAISYTVVDLSGREMTFETVAVASESVHTVDVSTLAPGVYVLRITTGTEVHNLKFTKE